jgi:hypothetical protein
MPAVSPEDTRHEIREGAKALTFPECVEYCAGNRELVENFDRLTGHNLSLVGRGAPIDQMIDEATGRHEEGLRAFILFVWECVWMRLPPETFERIDAKGDPI